MWSLLHDTDQLREMLSTDQSLIVIMVILPPVWNEIFLIWQAAILDDRKSLSIAFLSILDQYATLIFVEFCSQNGCRRPFLMTENHFRSHFSLFRYNTQLLYFFAKWAPVAILDDRKSLSIAFLTISDQYTTFFSFTKWPPAAILDDRKSLSIVFLTISDQYETLILFEFFHKMAASGHSGWPKITFNRILRHFRSIRNLLFFSKWPRRPFCAKNNRVIPLCVINGHAKYEVDRWIYDKVRDATSFLSIFSGGHFVFPIDAINHRVLVIWDLNGYGEYEFDMCICDKVMAYTSVGVRRRRQQRRKRQVHVFQHGHNFILW